MAATVDLSFFFFSFSLFLFAVAVLLPPIFCDGPVDRHYKRYSVADILSAIVKYLCDAFSSGRLYDRHGSLIYCTVKSDLSIL